MADVHWNVLESMRTFFYATVRTLYTDKNHILAYVNEIWNSIDTTAYSHIYIYSYITTHAMRKQSLLHFLILNSSVLMTSGSQNVFEKGSQFI